MNTAFLKSYQVLTEVYTEKAFSSIALNKALTFCKQQDKSLVTKIVYGVLDNDIKLEYIISKFVKKLPKAEVLLFLKLGTYCLTDLSIPPYAVVNDVAELSKVTADRHVVGFVNATLKTISANVKDFSDYPTEPTENLSVRYSYPLWAVKKLVKDYGTEVATQIVTYQQDRRTTARFVGGLTCEQISDKYGVTAYPTPFADGFVLDGKLPIQDESFTVQSLSSMAVAHVCANGLNGDFLDCCSAPGGKAVYVKQLQPNAQVTACDVYPHRVQLIDSYAKRMGVQIDTHVADMSVYDSQFDGKYDTVLCDVPCSGFGVLNNRPDIKLFRQNVDISNLMKLQYSVIDNCCKYVKVGGRLVYSTCTVFDNENGQNIRKFLKEHDNFVYDNIVLPEFSSANGQCSYQFLPHKDGVQGFFVAVLKRIK